MINNLVDKLNEILGLVVMVFADDIALIADSRMALIRGIECIEQWCTETNMQLNKKKS